MEDKDMDMEDMEEIWRIEESPIDKLNDDCLALVFAQLPSIRDLVKMESVSKRWKEVASHAWKSRRFLSLTENTEENWGWSLETLHARLTIPVIRSMLRKCGAGLRGIEATHSCVFSRVVMENIGEFCPNLDSLSIRTCTHVNVDHPFSISMCRKIKKFSIVHLVDEKFLTKILSKLRILKSLTIQGDEECYLENVLFKLPSTLEELHLCDVDICEQAFRQAIPRLTKLRAIAINCCNNINPEMLEILSTMESLKSVKLSGRLLYIKAPQMARFICSLRNLDELDVSLLNNNKLDRSLRERMESLVFICCWCCSTQPSKSITDNILSIIAVNCPKLKSITITGPFEITDAGIGTLVQLKELRTLKLEYCWTITDNALSNLSNLHHVSLLGCRLISDSGIVKLMTQSPELRTLNVLFSHAGMETILTAIHIAARRKRIPLTLTIDYRRKQDVAEFLDNYPKPPLFKFGTFRSLCTE